MDANGTPAPHIECEDCDRLNHQVTQDEARAHELATGHEVIIHVI